MDHHIDFSDEVQYKNKRVMVADVENILRLLDANG
jgi:hypothetical protein